MKYKACLSATSFVFALVTLAASASALPVAGAGTAVQAESQVIRVHGCHRSCEWGPALRWHRHVGPACRPIGCYPRAVNPGRCWVDGRGIRHCRW